uniref:Ribosomal protein S11 n=2 Tax=Gelidium TaxID=2811 RepID=A0A1D8X7K9_9FLOR|nr:ribosomal protein S11 [Gelidium sinicola]YP_009559270.1 ribosomal protein S11 [Gelidium coulteri]AOX49018.1 ribosomal protein S11 [Gelidium sinicola]QBA96117.1 ribosomal protein S11 [Gelidium coulteri]
MLPIKSKSLVLKILFTSTNILYCLANIQGNVIFWTSAGTQKIKGTKKITSTAIEAILNQLFKKAKALGYSYLHIQLKGFNKNKKFILKFFKQTKLEILSISDQTSLPHNGCKIRKVKRI